MADRARYQTPLGEHRALLQTLSLGLWRAEANGRIVLMPSPVVVLYMRSFSNIAITTSVSRYFAASSTENLVMVLFQLMKPLRERDPHQDKKQNDDRYG